MISLEAPQAQIKPSLSRMSKSDQLMLLAGLYLALGLLASLLDLASPFLLNGISCALSAFLCWKSGRAYRLFAWALTFLTLGIVIVHVLRHYPVGVYFIFLYYALLLAALWKLPGRHRPSFLAWILWCCALALTAFVVWLDWEYSTLPLHDSLYATGHLLFILAMLPALGAALDAQAPYGRFLLILGVFINWTGIIFHDLNIYSWALDNHRFTENIWFMGNALLGLGVYCESRRIHVKLWPFVLGVGSLEAVWIMGVLGLQSLYSPFFKLWLLMGAPVFFASVLALIQGHRAAFAKSRRRLYDWLDLLDDLSRTIEKDAPLEHTLQDAFERLHAVVPGLLGLEIRGEDTPYLMGQRGICALPIFSGEEEIGLLYAENPQAFADLRQVSPWLGARLREIVLKLDLRDQSLKDPLTGLYNRRGLNCHLGTLFRKAKEENSPCALLMIDLDHFKKVNDTHGHETGDQALRATARAMLHVFRESDLCVRFGGEEFLVVLNKVDLNEARMAAERFLKELSSLDLGIGWPLTASIGVAGGIAPHTQDDFGLWRQVADQGCYMAKQGGRNKVVVFSSPTSLDQEAS